MKRINRYILRKYFHVFFLALAIFVGLYLLVDFFEKVDDLIEHDAPLGVYFSYFALKIPLIIVQVCPMAVLLGVFMTLGGLSRTSELAALWASGVSLVRIAAPLVVAAWLISFAVLLINENLVPLSVRTMNLQWATQVEREPDLVFKKDRLWMREGNTIVNVQLAEPEENRLQGISIFRFDDDFQLLERIMAERAHYQQEEWLVAQGTRYRFAPGSGQLRESEKLVKAGLPLDKKPGDFQIAEMESEEMNFRQLRSLSRKLRSEGYDPTRLVVDMHNRLASPFAALIMAFIGIPFSLQKNRGGKVALGVAITVAIGFSYHVLQAICLALGYADLLPPAIAAWVTNLLFLLIGIWLLLAEKPG